MNLFSRVFYIFITLFLLFNISFSQKLPDISEVEDTTVIELIKKINSATHDSIIVRAYMEWDNIIYIENPQLDLLLNKKVVELCDINLAKKLQYVEQTFFLHSKAFSLNNIGTSYCNRGMLDSASYCYLEVIKLCKKFDYKSGIGDGYLNLSSVYYFRGDYVTAINYLLTALKIQEELGDIHKQAQILGNIGSVFLDQGDLEKALEYQSKSYEANKKIENKMGMVSSLDNIGLIFFQKKNYDKSIEYHTKSLKIANELKSSDNIARIEYNIGACYLKKNQIDLAYDYFIKSLKIAEEYKYLETVSKAKLGIGEFYFVKGDYNKATSYFVDALTISKSVGTIIVTTQILDLLYQSYVKTNNYKDALQSYEEYVKMNDSISNERSQKEVLKKEFSYQTEKNKQELVLKNKDIKLLEKDKKIQNYLLLGLGVVLLMAIGIGILSYRNYKQKQKQVELKNIALEQKLLRLQMNPHFIFNSLSSISGQMLHNLNAARDYLAKFARLMRLILENSREAYVTMKSEVDALNYYMILEQQRFKDKFDFKIDIDSQILIDETEIPPMLIQPHIENAILHGIVPKGEKGIIQVKFIKETETSIRCEIQDNGIGRKKSSQKKKDEYTSHKSLALEITKERLETLSEETHQALKFKIDDLEDEAHEPTGTKVTIVLPCKTV